MQVVQRLGKDIDADTRQDLMERLLLPRNGALPRLFVYGGAGSLLGWVKTVARNLATSARRREPPVAKHEGEAVAPTADPEIGYMRFETASELADAFRRASADLSPRDRRLLRMHIVEKRTVQDIAEKLEVHRETAGRWLQSARARLATRTRARLESSLDVGREEAVAIIEEGIEDGRGSLGRLLAGDCD